MMTPRRRFVSFLPLVALVTGCFSEAAPEDSAVDSPPPTATEDWAGASQEELLEQVLRELPTEGDPEIVAKRAELEQALATLRSSGAPVTSEDGAGEIQQALSNSDGCSTPWMADILLRVVLVHSPQVFYNQCVWHDHCYSSGRATYGFSRGQCDSSWLNKMESRCDSMYPWYIRLTGAGTALWLACHATADVMHDSVRLFASDYFMSTPCVGGQIWPATGWNGPCSTYEAFDTAAPLCTGASGVRLDGSVGPNWNGCRGTGCSACTDALAGYPNYFKNNPSCKPNSTCAGSFYQCGSACPAPDWSDR